MGEKKRVQFDALDSLRGIAAIGVAIFHYQDTWAGHLAVDFFLVLSGFILSHSYLHKEYKTRFLTFISHRLARLYPLHIFTLFIFVGVYYWTRGHSLPTYPGYQASVWLQQMTLTQNIGLPPNKLTFNLPSWSISVEFWVNILFIVFISKKTKSIWLFCIATAGILLIYIKTGNIDVHAQNYFGFLNAGLVRGLASFLLGIIAYRVYLFVKMQPRIRDKATLLEMIVVAMTIFVVYCRDGQYSSLDMLAPYVFLMMVVIFALDAGIFSKLLKPIRYLGTISYSIYLNQFAVILLSIYYLKPYHFPTILGIPMFLILYLTILLVYSHFTYRYIENPLRTRGRDFLSRFIPNNTPDTA